MKKIAVFVLIALMLSFTAVSAASVDPVEIGNTIGWEHTFEEVKAYFEDLGGYEIEASEEPNDIYLKARYGADDKTQLFAFNFQDGNRKLWDMEMIEIIFDDDYVPRAYEALIDAYELTEVPEYYDPDAEDYLSDYDEGFTVAGDGTIAIVGIEYATDENYGYITLLLIDRNYFENN